MKLMGYNSQMETTIDSLRSAAVLLVGFFARARASVLAIVVASATAVGLAACGGGGGGDASSSTAYFHGAARVEGLQYQYEDGGGGKTDARGRFAIEQGKTVVFSVGEATTLGTVVFSSDAGRDFVTPSRVAGNDQALRVERLLIALDDDSKLNDDSHLDNGIKIPVAAMTSTTNLLEIDQLRDGNNGNATMTVVDGLTLHIPDEAQARQALARTNNCAYSGVFAGDFDNEDVAIVLMPNLAVPLTVALAAETVTLTNASPIVSFMGGGESVTVGGTVLAIGLKTPPLTVTIEFDDDTMAMGTIILASYDRIEFRAGGAFGAVRRVAGDPNADYRLAGIDGEGGGAFLADIYDGRNAQISSINSPNAQNILEAERTGVFPTGSDTTLTLRAIDNSGTATLALRANNIFLGAGDNDNFGGTWCEL